MFCLQFSRSPCHCLKKWSSAASLFCICFYFSSIIVFWKKQVYCLSRGKCDAICIASSRNTNVCSETIAIQLERCDWSMFQDGAAIWTFGGFCWRSNKMQSVLVLYDLIICLCLFDVIKLILINWFWTNCNYIYATNWNMFCNFLNCICCWQDTNDIVMKTNQKQSKVMQIQVNKQFKKQK